MSSLRPEPFASLSDGDVQSQMPGYLGCGFKVWSLGFRVGGLGFRVHDFGFKVWGVGFTP